MQKIILIIEDELPIQRILKAFLTDAGYSVVAAGDGMEGIAVFQTERFDLVLLDIMMPKLDGYTVLQSLSPCRWCFEG